MSVEEPQEVSEAVCLQTDVSRMGIGHRITESVDNQISVSSGKVTLMSTVHQGAFWEKNRARGAHQACPRQARHRRLQVTGFEVAGVLSQSGGETVVKDTGCRAGRRQDPRSVTTGCVTWTRPLTSPWLPNLHCRHGTHVLVCWVD